MFQLLDFVLNIFTFLIPLILTFKILDESITFKYASYQFIINYWLYFIFFQYLHYNYFEGNLLFSYANKAVKFWLFYGSTNNLRLLNHLLFTRFISKKNFNQLEVTYINPLINKINPNFKELNYQIYMAGKIYLKPINYTQQLQFITTFLSVFVPPTETRIKGSSSSNTQPSSSSRIIKKLRKPRRTTSDNTGTTSPDVRSRSSSLGSKSNQSIHSSNSSNRSSPTSPILNPLDNTNNLLHIPKYRRSSNGSPPPYEEIIPDISLNNYRAASGSHSQSSRSSSQTIPTPMATRSAGIDMTLFSNRTGSPDLVSDMRVSNSSISRIQESLNQRGNGNELPPMPTPRMLR